MRLRRSSGVFAAASLAVCCVVMPIGFESTVNAAPPRAPIASPGFRIDEFARGLDKPTSMNWSPDGRLFVTEKLGKIRIVQNGKLLSAPALSLPVNAFRERGLLSLEFDPNFASNGFIYVFYTSNVGGCHHQVSRFTITGNTANPNSELMLIATGPCGSGGHNGGSLHMAPDGRLMITVGEQNIAANAQNMTNLFGKVLRINRDGSIPTSNPFYTTATGRNRAIYAIGFRNPFTSGFDPITGDFFVNDVGEHTWEEVNRVKSGGNYGWPTTEGQFDRAQFPQFTPPVYAYAHGIGPLEGCAIVGGVAYGPSNRQLGTRYLGKWFFADYCGNWIHVLDPNTGAVERFVTDAVLIADLDVGPDGALYYLDRNTVGAGAFVRKVTRSKLPGISKNPNNTTVEPGTKVTFNVIASGDGAKTYQWFRNGNPVGGATRSSYAFTATAAMNNDRISVDVSNSAGTTTSPPALLRVISTGAGAPPSVTINSPTAGTRYRGGQTIAFSASATDPEDGVLPASAYNWEIVFHHGTHTHPFVETLPGVTRGTVRIPNKGETATDVWYRIHVTVTDRGGQTTSVFRDIHPLVQVITLKTRPPGLSLEVNGSPRATTSTFASVVGVLQTFNPPSPQTVAGSKWVFDTWADADGAARRITTNANPRTYTANYRIAGGATGAGAGMPTKYYNEVNFTGSSVSTNSRVIAINHNGAGPVAGIAGDGYSVVYEGTILPQFTERYQITVDTNGATRMWINGVLKVDRLANRTRADLTTSLNLTAGRAVAVRVEISFPGPRSFVELLWSSTTIPRSLVPRSQMSGG